MIWKWNVDKNESAILSDGLLKITINYWTSSRRHHLLQWHLPKNELHHIENIREIGAVVSFWWWIPYNPDTQIAAKRPNPSWLSSHSTFKLSAYNRNLVKQKLLFCSSNRVSVSYKSTTSSSKTLYRFKNKLLKMLRCSVSEPSLNRVETKWRIKDDSYVRGKSWHYK